MSNVAVQKLSEETSLPDQCLEELLETEAGFDAREIDVKRNGDVRFSEFSDCELFRRMEFPAPIDVETVTAKVEKGVLGVMARKAAVKKETERKISLAAA